jgi:hypothetical protein
VVVSIIKESSFVVHCCLPAIFALLLQNAGRSLCCGSCVASCALRVAHHALQRCFSFLLVKKKKQREKETAAEGEEGE